MTSSKIILLGASDATHKLIEWATSGHFSIISHPTFSAELLVGASLIILSSKQSPEIISTIQSQEIPILYILQSDELETHQELLKNDKTDYIIQPFYPQDCLFRITKNALPPIPQVLAALFDPRGLIPEETRKKWQQLGIEIHTFIQDKPLLAFIKSNTPDIVICDAALPTHNAEILLESLKSKNIPIFSLFAEQSLTQLENNSLYHQAEDYSMAPFEADALLLRIKRILKKKLPPRQQKSHPKKTNNGDKPSSQNGNTPVLMSHVNVTLNHEIRSPLTSILIGAQVLKKKSEEDSQAYQIAKEIEDASRRIQTTLDDFSQVKNVVIDDYINGIKMLNLKRSRQSESEGNGTC